MSGSELFMQSTHSPQPFSKAPPRRVRFGEFAADFEQRELFRRGVRQPLQHKPFRILELLVTQPGALVTRQELAKELWPGSRASFEKNLNTAVNSLRLALGDSLQPRRFIETRAGLGYRFIARVAEMAEPVWRVTPVLNADAEQDCLAARYLLNKMTSGDLYKAVAHYRAALRQDPACPQAAAGLADAYTLLSLQAGLRSGDVCQEARALALSAVEAAPALPEAHIALARTKMVFDWDWHGARGACRRALELGPHSAEAYRCQALLLSVGGEHDEACRAAARACELDPFSLPAGITLAGCLFWARDYEAAGRQCWKLLNLEPRLPAAQSILGMVYEQQNELAEAIVEFQNAYHCSGCDPANAAALAHALALSGDRAGAEHLMAGLHGCGSAFLPAIAYCGLSDCGSALEYLEKAVRERDPLLISLPFDPRFDPLRSYPTFDRFLQRIGLPSAWRASA